MKKMSYCTIEDVLKFTNAQAKHSGYKNNPEEFEALIQDWIQQSESLINSYCRKQWTENVPGVIRNVTIRLTAKILELHYEIRDQPIRNAEDYNIQETNSEIFTDAMKTDLKPFRKTKKTIVFNI